MREPIHYQGMGLFDKASAYTEDLPLLKKLGLILFEDVDVWQDCYLGRVRGHDRSWCKVWVKCAPAQFWTFQIYCAENNTVTVLSTGSGSLTEYWPIAKAVMDCMFAVKELHTVGCSTNALEPESVQGARNLVHERAVELGHRVVEEPFCDPAEEDFP